MIFKVFLQILRKVRKANIGSLRDCRMQVLKKYVFEQYLVLSHYALSSRGNNMGKINYFSVAE